MGPQTHQLIPQVVLTVCGSVPVLPWHVNDLMLLAACVTEESEKRYRF
jgi:hypothetical protein